MAWRYIVQRALTGQVLTTELPLNREELRWELSGPGQLRGTLPPDFRNERAADGSLMLDEWGTCLFAEQDGRIRWGGILTQSRYEGGTFSVTAKGYSAYPVGIPYLGPYYRQVSISPLAVADYLWTYLQSQPSADLGVQVVTNGATSARVGTPSEPYELAPWEATDCGQELAALAAEAPFDYTEDHAWSTGQTISHKLTLWSPRAGRRRTDLVFNEDNLRAVVPFERDGEGTYGNHVHVIGKGEGNKTLTGGVGIYDRRLRRVQIITDKLASTTGRCVAIARAEHARRTLQNQVAGISVSDHPNAEIGAWSLGDDVPVNVVTQQLGTIETWHRIVAWSLGPTDDQAALAVAPSESFNYSYGNG